MNKIEYPLHIESAPDIENEDWKLYFLTFVIEHTDILKYRTDYSLHRQTELLKEYLGSRWDNFQVLMGEYRKHFLTLIAKQPFFRFKL